MVAALITSPECPPAHHTDLLNQLADDLSIRYLLSPQTMRAKVTKGFFVKMSIYSEHRAKYSWAVHGSYPN